MALRHKAKDATKTFAGAAVEEEDAVARVDRGGHPLATIAVKK